MTNNEKLVAAFAASLGVDADKVADSLSYGGGTWDSVAHMVLVTAIEASFDIMLDTDEILDMSSFGKAREIVATHGVDFDAQG